MNKFSLSQNNFRFNLCLINYLVWFSCVLWYVKLFTAEVSPLFYVAQSAGAVEYIVCFSVEG